MPHMGGAGSDVRLRLLDGFDLHCRGQALRLSSGSQRLLAFLALHDRPMRRIHVAASLWLDVSEDRSRANLRSALWRLPRTETSLVEIENDQLCLGREVVVDVASLVTSAKKVLEARLGDDDPHLDDMLAAGELLPDWYEDWVLTERDRVHQLRMHALEALAERLAQAGRYGEAVEAALMAIRAEPLRESAHRVLIRVHLAEGNRCEALTCYRLFQERLRDQVALAPSPQMEALVAGLHDSGRAR